MNHFLINGMQKVVSNSDTQTLSTLIEEIRSTYSGDTSLISTIMVNGVEIDTQDEQLIGKVPVSDLKTLEVFTAHPKEIAEDTLQSLVEFSKHLEMLCSQVAENHGKLPKLADGIMTFIDALENVKRILQVTSIPSVRVLEADLASILKDILDYQKKKDAARVTSTVKNVLMSNLALWRTEGLPVLIRSRDS